MSLTWGVDGFGRAHLTADGRTTLLSGLDGVSGYSLRYYYLEHNMDELLDFKNLSYQPKKHEIITAKSFKIIHQGTEYIFETMEDAQEFSRGFKQGLQGGKDNPDSKCFTHGYQVARYGTK